jgi:putative nucleotidyltransferase with HDIG domain
MSQSNSSGAGDEAPLVSIEKKGAQRAWVPLLLCALFVIAGLSLTLALPAIPRSGPLATGMVGTHDVLAPRRVTYVSRLLTEDARAHAEASVEPVYVVDPNVARQQLNRVSQILAYVGSIRQDNHASLEDKARWISKISDLVLPPSVVTTVVSLDGTSWQSVSSEVSYLLDRLMREGVRDDQLEETRRQVPQQVSYALLPEQAEVVSALVQAMLRPSRFFDEQQTADRRQQARDAVQPVQVVIEQGEAVLRQGDIVTPLHLEQLTALGLQPSQPEIHTLLSMLLFVVALALVLSLYIWQARREMLRQRGRIALLSLLIVVTGVAAKFAMPGHVLLPYFFPMAAFAMLVSVLIDTQLSIVATLTLSLFVGFVTGGSLDLTVYVLLGSVVAALVVSRLEHLGTFAWAAVATAVVNAIVALAFRLFSWGYDPVGLLQLAGASVANGVLSASLTFTSFFWLGNAFGIATPLQLLELARPTHPLTRRLLMEAPGTYHHSLIVGNLSERAAHMVGADPLVVRVAALHHDVGKVLRPYFFVENQASGENYHQQLDPKTSAEIIISHVRDSLDLARKYHFPQRVLDIMAQHHGTTSVGFGYFYREACKEADGGPVDEAIFRYPGPRPQSKEAAIVMLADSVEAAVRASSPSSAGEIERIVRKITNDRLVSGELDECQLTLRDLDVIRSAFIDVLQGVSHLRIQYPEKDSMTQQREA